jgi:hypothetical protein
MYLFMSLVLFALLANIVWPMIVQKIQFESKVMAYMNSNNITNPYCYTKYLGKISRSILGIEIDIGVDSHGIPVDCNNTPSVYLRCSPFNYTNALHPCSYIKSYFRTFALN